MPPAHVRAAVTEAADAGIGLAVVITEGVPVHDTVAFTDHARRNGTRVVGPNYPGLISPGRSNAGIIPADITKPGPVGLVTKSGTLTYQLRCEVRDFGFSTCVGIGGDPIVGTTHIDYLRAFEDDPDTRLTVLIGEIGGDAEERAAAPIRDHVTKPVVGYVAGFTAPEAGPWVTPAPSSPAPRAPPPPRKPRSRPPASGWVPPPPSRPPRRRPPTRLTASRGTARGPTDRPAAPRGEAPAGPVPPQLEA